MKCELCHQSDAKEAIFRNGNEDDEIYVCAACAKAEKSKHQRKSQRTRKITGLPPGVSMSITEISRSPDGEVTQEDLSDNPPPILGAIMNAFSSMVDDMEKTAQVLKQNREKKSKTHDLPANRAAAPFRIKDGFHLEGLHLIGELDATKRALRALDMELIGITADGVNETGHVYRLTYQGSSERAKRVVEDLLREEKNARVRLKEEMPRVFGDSLCRALAILKNCRLLSSGELFDLLSPMRLAAKEKMLDGIKLSEIESLMNEQDLTNSEDRLPQDERDRVDAERADEMNRRFEEVMLNDVL